MLRAHPTCRCKLTRGCRCHVNQHPVLVCEACETYTKHRLRDIDRCGTNGASYYELTFQCTECRKRRPFGNLVRLDGMGLS